MTVRFDDAWQLGKQLAVEAAQRSGHDITLVRDLLGRISLIVDDRARDFPAEYRNTLAHGLTARAGKFASPTPVLVASDLFEPESMLTSGTVPLSEGDGYGEVRIADHGVVGAEWGNSTTHPPTNRVTLYGFKGGVGRSTATYVLAQHLADLGYCVLVVDLDLESPGVGALLQDDDQLPNFGIVDHIVESAVGNEKDLDLVVRSQVVNTSGTGEVWMAPAGGRPRYGYDYLAKLNRVYLDLPVSGTPGYQATFAGRLRGAIEACENEVERTSRKPDVVLLDSRAGIHDIAAVAITQLSALSLLFAIDNPQTWAGYRALFKRWGENVEQARAMRDRLKMVAAFVPARSSGSYLAGFRENAQSCFAETLYDNVVASGVNDAEASAISDADPFNPATEDDYAPHSPLPILFASDLVGLDPAKNRNWHGQEFVRAAYRDFLSGAEELILGALN